MIPFFRLLDEAAAIFDRPGNEVADNMAEAISVFFANCLLFILNSFY
jgi:hypothetical protein